MIGVHLRHRTTGLSARWHIPALIALCGLLYFTNLAAYPLFDEDEPRFAAAAREMIELRDFVTPHFNYQWRLNKPVFFYWCEIACYKVFGIGELAPRLPSAIFMSLVILITYLMCRAILGARAGLASAVALAIPLQIVVLGRAAVVDATLMFFITACVFSFFLGFTGHRGWYFAAYAAAGLAALTKGPIGLAIPGAAILPFLIHVRGLRKWLREGHVLPGLALFLLIVLPWYIAEIRATQGVYVKAFLIGENVGRYTKTVGHHVFGVWFYIAAVLVGFFPASCLLIPAAACVRIRKTREMDTAAQFRLLCAWWAVTTVGAFSLSATQLPHYVAPSYPAMAALVGAFLAEPSAWRTRCGRLMKISTAMIVLLAAVFAAVFAVLPRVAEAKREYLVAPGQKLDLGWSPTVLAAIFGVMAVAFLVMMLARRRSQAISMLAVGMIAADMVVITGLAPMIGRLMSEPPRDLARKAAAIVGRQGEIIAYDAKSSNLVFYAQRRIHYLDKEQTAELARRLKRAEGPRRVAVITKARLLTSERFAGLNVVSRRGIYVLLADR